MSVPPENGEPTPTSEGRRVGPLPRLARGYLRLSERTRVSLWCGVAVFVAGFGIMTLVWHFGDWDPTLPGAFAYKSFAVGDSLVLPLAVGLLVAAGRWDEGFTGWRRVLLIVLAAAGLAAGAGTQALWLLDSATVLNWSIPRQHHFNFAGWYHAVFLSVMAGVLSALTAAAAVRWWEDHRPGSSPRQSGPLLVRAGGLLVLSGFGSLWLIDTFTIHAPLPHLFSAVLPVPLLVAAILIVTARGERQAVSEMSALVITALVSIFLLALAGGPTNATVGLSAAAFGVYSIAFAVPWWRARRDPEPRKPCPLVVDHERLGFIVVVHVLHGLMGAACALYILDRYGVSAASLGWVSGLILASAAIVLVVSASLLGVSVLGQLYRWRILITAFFLVTIVTFGAAVHTLVEDSAYDAAILLWATTIIVAMFWVKHLMRLQIAAEDRGEMTKGDRREIPHPDRATTYVWGLSALSAAVLLYVIRLVSDLEADALNHIPASLGMALPGGILGALLLAVTAIGSSSRRGDRSLVLVVVLVAAVSLVVASVRFIPWDAALTGQGDLRWVPAVVLFFSHAGLLAFVTNGLLSNALILRGKRITVIDAAIAVVTGIIVAAAVSSGIVAVVLVSGVAAPLILAVCALPALVVPRLVAFAWIDSSLATGDMKTAAGSGIFQDTLLSVLLCFFVTYLPLYSILSADEVPSAIIESIAFLSSVGAVYGWGLSLDLEHADRFERDVRAGNWPPKEKNWEYLDADSAPRLLDQHVRRQCLISIVMLVPVIPFVFSQLDAEAAVFGWRG